ncbi:MAG: vanadium-dependent haloperoxidase [Thermoanaerobaculia bacterium]
MRRVLTLSTAFLLLGALPPAGATERTGEVVAAWNDTVLSLAREEDGFLTLKGLRTAAMGHLAMHDALNHVDARFETYLPVETLDSAPQADPLAAAVQAGYDVALDQYPDRAETLGAFRERWLGGEADDAARASGVELGHAAARAVLGARRGDGWNGEAEYRWHPMGPGVYAEFNEHSNTPEGFVFGAGWAVARPFLLPAADAFRSPPPPAIDSPEYTAAFAEVKEVGRHESATRTADQTHLAMWWKDFAENSHNRLARSLVASDGLELWRTARLFALLETALYDSYVNVFYNKFFYNHWRPFTAIRWADKDGNPDTEVDAGWNNLHHHTYAFPSYPSAHGTVCAAAMTVIADTFGDDRPFTMETREVDGAGPMSEKIRMEPSTRSFPSFADAAMECALSRVYLGIHFRYDSVAGNRLGRLIGLYELATSLRPLPEEGSTANAPSTRPAASPGMP